MKNKLRIW